MISIARINSNISKNNKRKMKNTANDVNQVGRNAERRLEREHVYPGDEAK